MIAPGSDGPLTILDRAFVILALAGSMAMFGLVVLAVFG
jgi:hypothetical protein